MLMHIFMYIFFHLETMLAHLPWFNLYIHVHMELLFMKVFISVQ